MHGLSLRCDGGGRCRRNVHQSFQTAFVRGILANILVCMAIWLATAGRTLSEKLLGIVLPVSTFIAAGFEHSVATMYFVPIGVLLSAEPEALTADTATRLEVPGTVHNLAVADLMSLRRPRWKIFTMCN